MRRLANERGGYVVITAIVAVLLIPALLALLGLSLGFINKVKHKHTVNLAATAALAGFMEDLDGSHNERVERAILRANEILTNDFNLIRGEDGTYDQNLVLPINQYGNNDDGSIELGHWFEDCANINPALSGEPCFVRASQSGSNPQLNSNNLPDAVRITSLANKGNPILTPFAKMIKQLGIAVKSEAIASVRPRCVMIGVDVSPSTVQENFDFRFIDSTLSQIPLTSQPRLGRCIPQPPATSCTQNNIDGCLCFVPRSSFVYSLPNWPTNQPLGNVCLAANANWWASPVQRDLYCNWTINGTRPVAYEQNAPNLNRFHYKNDYGRVNTQIYGPLLVSRYANPLGGYFGPEPYYSVFASINASMRVMQSIGTSADSFGVLIFNNDSFFPAGDPFSNQSFRPDPLMPISIRLGNGPLPLLIQLTNNNNRGLISRIGVQNPSFPNLRPNFLDFGWYPDVELRGSSTNLNSAIHKMLLELNNNCSAEAQKIAILATDGMSTCVNRSVNTITTGTTTYPDFTSGDPAWPDWGTYRCATSRPGNPYQAFVASANEFEVKPPAAVGANTLLELSRALDVNWIVLHFGSVDNDLGIRNIISDEWTDWYNSNSNRPPPEKFYTYKRAGEVGQFSGIDFNRSNPGNYAGPDSMNIVDFNHRFESDEGRTAFDLGGFNGANGFLFELSKGGTYCPLIPPLAVSTLGACPANYEFTTVLGQEVCKLNDSARQVGQWEKRPIINESVQNQAARCIMGHLGNIPYVLRQELSADQIIDSN